MTAPTVSPSSRLAAANALGEFCAAAPTSPPPEHVELIVLCGSAVLQTPFLAAALMEAHPSAVGVITGGLGHSTQHLHSCVANSPAVAQALAAANFVVKSTSTEADIFFALVKLMGVDASRIMVERESTNCGDNARRTRQLLQSRDANPKAMLIIQDPTMQRRSVASFQKAWEDCPDVAIISFPPFIPSFQLDDASADSGLALRAASLCRRQDAVSSGGSGDDDDELCMTLPRWWPAHWQSRLSSAWMHRAARVFGGCAPPWSAARLLSLLLGEIPRLRDAPGGYGPSGAGFIAHIDVPGAVEEAWATLSSAAPAAVVNARAIEPPVLTRLPSAAVVEPFTAPTPTTAINELNALIGRDVGNRGIAHISLPHQLEGAAAAFLSSRAVAVVTGFPCRVNDTPPTETDGPPGAIALVTAALAMGKSRVTIVTDDCNADVLRACAAAAGVSDPRFRIASFPPRSGWSAAHSAALDEIIAQHDHTIAIERAAVGVDGIPYTMRGIRMDHLVAPVDRLVTEGCACGSSSRSDTAPLSTATRTSTGIGDGGNELGMGKVLAAVQAHIPNGPLIAAASPCDWLITAGVSNWGGWALVGAVEVLMRSGAALVTAADYQVTTRSSGAGVVCDIIAACSGSSGTHSSACTCSGASPPTLLPSDSEEITLCDAMSAAGARDGITGFAAPAGSVDGFPMSTHLQVLQAMREIVARHSGGGIKPC